MKPEDYYQRFSVYAPNAAEREAKIRDILARGKIVRFSFGDIFKDVGEWNADSGDLKAFRTSPNAITQFVCWACDQYQISEIEPD